MSGSQYVVNVNPYGQVDSFSSVGSNNPTLIPVGDSSIFNLLNPQTYQNSNSSSATPAGAGTGLTGPAQTNFNNFLNNAFTGLQTQGSQQFGFLGSTFSQWAGWQQGFANQVGQAFQTVVGKTAKASGGLLSSIFG